jgi:imidazoleglycerol-phosphate dehydratase
MQKITVERKTKETDIAVTIGFPEETDDTTGSRDSVHAQTGVPFLDHMLNGMLFHGGFTADIRAAGDVEIDAHHTVEDTGIVLGQVFRRYVDTHGPVARFGHGLVPMDDALGEAVVDISGRSYLVFRAEFPQPYAGAFDLALVREFFQGFVNNGAINLHLIGHYALNGHHLAESLYKASGRALGAACRRVSEVRSTKGVL